MRLYIQGQLKYVLNVGLLGMNKIEYLKQQFIPKSNKLKVIYGILWVLEPWIMLLIISYKIAKEKEKQ